MQKKIGLPGKVVPRVSFSLYWQVRAVVLDGKISSRRLLHHQQREAINIDVKILRPNTANFPSSPLFWTGEGGGAVLSVLPAAFVLLLCQNELQAPEISSQKISFTQEKLYNGIPYTMASYIQHNRSVILCKHRRTCFNRIWKLVCGK